MSNPVANEEALSKSSESDRRRSARVMLVVQVEVKWMTKDGPWVQEHAETEIVSQHGAMLKMKSRLHPGVQIEIRRPSVGLSVKGKVVGVGNPSTDGLARVAVEITTPSDSFWGVSFPSASATPAKPPMSLSPNRPAPSKTEAKPTPVSSTTAVSRQGT